MSSEKLEVGHQEVVSINGVRMTVLNVAGRSIIVRPEGEPVYMIKGVACKIKRLLSNGDYVFTPLDRQAEVKRIAPTDK
jgi:hypothetical protein